MSGNLIYFFSFTPLNAVFIKVLPLALFDKFIYCHELNCLLFTNAP